MAGTATQTQSTQTQFRDKVMDQHDIPILGNFYTKAEVDAMVAEAVEEARRIDEASMAKHNREATIISMILGFTCLALFLDGLLRILGIIPPFMHLDVNVIDQVKDQIETDILDDVIEKVRQVPIKKLCYTKAEIDAMIAEAVEEARRIDEASMAKHNREATIISMILGFTALALFLDGLLRILGIIPPFMHLDVNVIDQVKNQIETDIIDDVIEKVRQVPIKKLFSN